MMHIRVEAGRPVEISKEYPGCGDHWVPHGKPLAMSTGWMSVRDLASVGDACTMAAYLTAMTGATWLPVDEGRHCSPQFRVTEAPKMGDTVSKSFNGDSYPCGEITRITKTWQITTDQGVKFRRHKETGGWRQEGGTWWMIAGEHDERNPHF